MGGREHQEHRALNFVLTGEQVRYRDEVRRFAERELNHDVDGRERLCREAWGRWAELGIMRRQLESCLRYARERRERRHLRQSIADMAIRLETSRLLLYRLAWLRGRRKRVPFESALVKLHVSETFLRSSLDALHAHGGLAESGLAREVGDAIGSRIYSGTSEIQRVIVARGLGLRPEGLADL